MIDGEKVLENSNLSDGMMDYIFSDAFQFTRVDFFLGGLVVGFLFDRFTTLFMILIYICATNRKLAGVESQQILKSCFRSIQSLVRSFTHKT